MTNTLHQAPIGRFTTHDGRVVEGGELVEALQAVAFDLDVLAMRCYIEDDYPAHVPFYVKYQNLRRGMRWASDVRQGIVADLTTAQRLNEKLTGKCIALLPGGKSN